VVRVNNDGKKKDKCKKRNVDSITYLAASWIEPI
jgi:hypothetical protein